MEPGRQGGKVMDSSVSYRIDLWWIDDDAKVTPPKERLPADLVRVAGGEVPLPDAFLTIVHFNQIQPCAVRELLEREVWAVTVIMYAPVACTSGASSQWLAGGGNLPGTPGDSPLLPYQLTIYLACSGAQHQLTHLEVPVDVWPEICRQATGQAPRS
jgi:hypothetical protein